MRLSRLSGMFACALAFVVGGLAAAPASRLDVMVLSGTAKVWVDDKEQGTASTNSPCVVSGLAVGRHHVHVQAPSCVAEDAIVEISGPNSYVKKDFTLAEEKGLVLVKTIPAGAEVKCNGVSLGTTPLLVTSLASGRPHNLELSVNGYRSKIVKVSMEGRRPLVIEENLSSDSGILKCISEPAGAVVTVNGVERGVTPLEVGNVPKGKAVVKFHLDGYQDEITEDLRIVAGDIQTLAVTLKGQPAQMTVVSTPEQAKVFVDDDYQGKTPTTVGKLSAGKHKLRVELTGYAPMTRDVEISNGAVTTEEFRLESVLGRIEVVTAPPGARILIDGKYHGSTKSLGGDAVRSQILLLENVPAGEHSIVARLDGCKDASRTVTVNAKDTGKVFIRLEQLFLPDTEIETEAGVQQGILVGKDAAGNITLQLSRGIRRTFLKDEIRKVTPILR